MLQNQFTGPVIIPAIIAGKLNFHKIGHSRPQSLNVKGMLFCFFSEEKYCYLRSKGIDRIINLTIQELELKLDPTKFIRVHRARILCRKHIKEFKSLGSGRLSIVLTDGTVVESSRSYSPEVRKIFSNESGES